MIETINYEDGVQFNFTMTMYDSVRFKHQLIQIHHCLFQYLVIPTLLLLFKFCDDDNNIVNHTWTSTSGGVYILSSIN